MSELNSGCSKNQAHIHDTMIFTLFTMRLSVTNGQIRLLILTRLQQRQDIPTVPLNGMKKGSIDSMIGIVYIITLKDFSFYNDFTKLALIFPYQFVN